MLLFRGVCYFEAVWRILCRLLRLSCQARSCQNYSCECVCRRPWLRFCSVLELRIKVNVDDIKIRVRVKSFETKDVFSKLKEKITMTSAGNEGEGKMMASRTLAGFVLKND